jgi:hypothetical protein
LCRVFGTGKLTGMGDAPAPPARPGNHGAAIAEAVFVTFLWSTSWVLIKLGLQEALPALTFARLRYTLAFVCLAPLVLADRRRRAELALLTGPVAQPLNRAGNRPGSL